MEPSSTRKFTFLSTLSLRRATVDEIPYQRQIYHFYPRSPCGERQVIELSGTGIYAFLSTLSLRRATISFTIPHTPLWHFYPRSPCGERLLTDCIALPARNFYPRSPCGERRVLLFVGASRLHISIHALLAESDGNFITNELLTALFLSTLSLRRATTAEQTAREQADNFYPRSPCGERQEVRRLPWQSLNFYPRSPCGERLQIDDLALPANLHFYPRSPCGERPTGYVVGDGGFQFLSTLSLRRATAWCCLSAY